MVIEKQDGLCIPIIMGTRNNRNKMACGFLLLWELGKQDGLWKPVTPFDGKTETGWFAETCHSIRR